MRREYAIIRHIEKAATDIYTFSDLREGGFTYVDKTGLILQLVNKSIGKQFFCARPRHFGKSLLVTTLQSLFEGRRELFKGLAVDRSDYDWKSYPVLRLDMGSCQADTVERFWEKVRGLLIAESERNGVALRKDMPITEQFKFLIQDLALKSDSEGQPGTAHKQKQMVLLLDEYDKPLLGHLGTPEVTKFKNALKEFYAVVETPKFIYLFEFKLRGTSEEALAQIEEKGYADRFASDPRKLFKIGCAFDWETRNLGKWLVA